MTRRTDKEVMLLLFDKESPLSKARAEFSFARARLEQSQATPIELRRLEFEAVEKIIGAYNGVQVDES